MKRRAPDASPGVEDERPAPILPKIEQNQTPDTDTEPDRRPILSTPWEQEPQCKWLRRCLSDLEVLYSQLHWWQKGTDLMQPAVEPAPDSSLSALRATSITSKLKAIDDLKEIIVTRSRPELWGCVDPTAPTLDLTGDSPES